MACNNCGGALTQTGVCLNCGITHRKFDIATLIIALVGIALYPALAMAAPIVISNFNFGGIQANIATAFSMLIPLSSGIEAVLMAARRKKTHKTAAACIFGIIGIIIGAIMLSQWVITIL